MLIQNWHTLSAPEQIHSQISISLGNFCLCCVARRRFVPRVMLNTVCSESAVGSPCTSGRVIGSALLPTPSAWQATPPRSVSGRCRRVKAQGLLDGFLGAFQENKSHAPELVAIDMESEGGLGGTSAEVFGPLAVILIGYHPSEFESFRSFMIDMEADMVRMICCNGDHQLLTLKQVLAAPTPDITKPKLGARRAVILSGMSGAEVSEVIGAYNDSGLPETVWAAAVPMNYERRISDLLQDIYGDHMFLRNNPNAVPR